MFICPNCGKQVSDSIPSIMNYKCPLCGQEYSSDKLLAIPDSDKLNNLYAKFDELYTYLVHRSSEIGAYLIHNGMIEKNTTKEGVRELALFLRSLTRITFEEILKHVIRDEKAEGAHTNSEVN
jgi:DNA-directed RNA polymerase subunit RPC12/RpoP